MTMMTEQVKDETKGMLVRGADGKLYFIPEAKLSAFAVPEKGTSQMEAKLPKGSATAQTSIPTEWMNVGLCIFHGGAKP